MTSLFVTTEALLRNDPIERSSVDALQSSLKTLGDNERQQLYVLSVEKCLQSSKTDDAVRTSLSSTILSAVGQMSPATLRSIASLIALSCAVCNASSSSSSSSSSGSENFPPSTILRPHVESVAHFLSTLLPNVLSTLAICGSSLAPLSKALPPLPPGVSSSISFVTAPISVSDFIETILNTLSCFRAPVDVVAPSKKAGPTPKSVPAQTISLSPPPCLHRSLATPLCGSLCEIETSDLSVGVAIIVAAPPVLTASSAGTSSPKLSLSAARLAALLPALLASLLAQDPHDVPPLATAVFSLLSNCQVATDSDKMLSILVLAKYFDCRTTASGKEGGDVSQSLAVTLNAVTTLLASGRDWGRLILKVAAGDFPAALTSSPVFGVNQSPSPPLKFLRLTPAKVIFLLTVASSVPSLRSRSFDVIAALVRENVAHVDRTSADRTSSWVERVSAIGDTPPPPASTTAVTSEKPPSDASLVAVPRASFISTVLSDASMVAMGTASSEGMITQLIGMSFALVDEVKKDSHTDGSSSSDVAASVGRSILKALFAGPPSATSEYINHTSTAVKRSIIKALTAKCTGRAPNAATHARLLLSLTSSQSLIRELSPFAPDLVSWLAQLASGGLPPQAASESLLPCLSSILQPSGRALLDDTLLYSKKSLFCADASRRSAAAAALVRLLAVLKRGDGVGGGSSSSSRSYDGGVGAGSAMEDELMGYLKRSLTQNREVRAVVYREVCIVVHQAVKQIEVDAMEVDVDEDEVDETAHIQRPAIAFAAAELLNQQLERYVDVEEDVGVREDRRRRAEELSQDGEVSMSQMGEQAVVDSVAPIRVHEFVAAPTSTANAGEAKEGSTPSPFAEASSRFVEPIGDLLIAATELANVVGPSAELSKTLKRLRERVSKSTIDMYTSWCAEGGVSDIERIRNTIASSLLVADMCESLFLGVFGFADASAAVGNIGEAESTRSKIVMGLFELMDGAITQAATSVYELQTLTKRLEAKPTAHSKSAKGASEKKGGGKKAAVVVEGDASESKGAIAGKERAMRAARDFLRESSLSYMKSVQSPSLLTSLSLFWASALNNYGAHNCRPKESKESVAERQQQQQPVLAAAVTNALTAGIASNIEVRRFIIERSHDFLCCPSTGHAGALQVAPLLFAEFAWCTGHRKRTSAAFAGEDKKKSAPAPVPLAVLALKGFLRGLTVISVTNSSPSPVENRISFLLDRAFKTTAAIKPDSDFLALHAKAIKSSENENSTFIDHKKRVHNFLDLLTRHASSRKATQTSQRSPIPKPNQFPGGSPTASSASTKVSAGLFSELVGSDMVEEAAVLCEIVSIAARCLDEGDRRKHAWQLLKTWDAGSAAFRGPLLLKSGNVTITDRSCVSAIPFVANNAILMDEDPMGDITKRLAIAALLAKPPSDDDKFFDEAHGFNVNSYRLEDRLCCINCTIDLDPESPRCSKNFAAVVYHVLNCVDSVLGDVEYVQQRVALGFSGKRALGLVSSVARRLLDVSEVVSTLAAVAPNVDVTTAFACGVLKAAKRLYGAVAKLMKQILECGVRSKAPTEVEALLTQVSIIEWNSTVNAVCALLSYIQETDFEESGGKKGALSDNAIKKQGLIASSLVFEAAKANQWIGKVAAKMRAAEFEDGALWYESVMLKMSDRGVKVTKEKVDRALEEEAELKTEKESGGKNKGKRKAKEEQTEEESDEDGEDMDLDEAPKKKDAKKKLAKKTNGKKQDQEELPSVYQDEDEEEEDDDEGEMEFDDNDNDDDEDDEAEDDDDEGSGGSRKLDYESD